jgi:hypothetical protein
MSKLVEDSVALVIVDRGKWSCLGCLSWGFEMHATDIQVLLEVIQLQEIGKFQCPDISAGGADFLLQIGDDSLQIGRIEAGLEELIPESLSVEA